ncbi:unnamed protein product [Orchesella dallaii]
MKRCSKPSRPGAAGDGNASSLERASLKHLQDDYFSFHHGNYGDPYSFAPYQHLLLVIDFVYNWTMDLIHGEPLAVLVIFIFQSLGILVNLILYIMASASRAMQVGMRKYVSAHHWLNLITSLVYMSLTVWWFIWALRKSWPSVSDQFSFTWPNSINTSSTSNATQNVNSTMGRLLLNGNITNSPTSPSSEVKEHYTLWSAGFNALYITHRTVAILYYFVYIRSSFLVLNTPTMENFLERKKLVVGQLKKLCEGDSNTDEKLSKARSTLKQRPHPSFSSAFKLDDYLKFNNGDFKESGGSQRDPQSNATAVTEKVKGQRRQILWAENDEVINDTREEDSGETKQGDERQKATTKKLNERTRRSRYNDKMGIDNEASEIGNQLNNENQLRVAGREIEPLSGRKNRKKASWAD